MINNMQSTINIPHRIEEVEAHDPADPSIFIPLNPEKLRGATLEVLLMFTEPIGRADGLRSWLKESVLRERGRRLANKDNTTETYVEAAAWSFPWHTLNDLELSEALSASESWSATDWSQFSDDANATVAAIHLAVCVACATRLAELHDAIQRSRKS